MAVLDKVGIAVLGLGNIARNSILPAFANSESAKLGASVQTPSLLRLLRAQSPVHLPQTDASNCFSISGCTS